jgi:hypothetical protein
MNDLAPLESFSALDDWTVAVPQWQPFRPAGEPRAVEQVESASS